MNKTQIQGYKKICPYCKTGIISMYQKQLESNFNVHVFNCPENPQNNKEEQNAHIRPN